MQQTCLYSAEDNRKRQNLCSKQFRELALSRCICFEGFVVSFYKVLPTCTRSTWVLKALEPSHKVQNASICMYFQYVRCVIILFVRQRKKALLENGRRRNNSHNNDNLISLLAQMASQMLLIKVLLKFYIGLKILFTNRQKELSIT